MSQSGGKRKRVKKSAKRKGMRKRSGSLSSKYSIEMLVAPQSGYDAFGGEIEDGGARKRRTVKRAAPRQHVKRTVAKKLGSQQPSPGRVKRRVRRASTGEAKPRAVAAGVKELALMGHDRLAAGLHVPISTQLPFDSKYLMLNPELRQKVAMADPVARNLLSQYGPGWSGYEIGLQMNGNKPFRKITSKSPELGSAMHPHYHPAISSQNLLVSGTGLSGPINLNSMLLGGPLGNQGRVSEWGLRYQGDNPGYQGDNPEFSLGLNENVKVEQGLESMPDHRMNVMSEYSPYGAPNVLTVANIGVDTKKMPPMKR